MDKKKIFILSGLICLFLEVYVFGEHSQAEVIPGNLLSYDSLKLESRNDGWIPLTKEEFSEREIEVAFDVANATAEFFDSLFMPQLSKGLFNIVGFGYRTKEYHDMLKEEFHIDIDINLSDFDGFNGSIEYKMSF